MATRQVQNLQSIEHRHRPLRRQLNEAFCGPDGRFSIGKFLATWAQIVVLGHMGTSWDKLIDKPESLLIVLTILVCPDVFKKFLAMKYGNGGSDAPAPRPAR